MEVNTSNQSISITKEQAEVIVNNAEAEISAEQKEGAEEIWMGGNWARWFMSWGNNRVTLRNVNIYTNIQKKIKKTNITNK